MIGRSTRLVARWEFRRFAKIRSQAVSVLVMLAIFAGIDMGGDLAGRLLDKERTIAVLEAGRLGLQEPLRLDNLSLLPQDLGPAAADSLLLAGDLDAVVLPHAGGWQLRVTRERGWQGALRAQVDALARQRALLDLDLDPRTLAAVTAPAAITTNLIGGRDEDRRQRPGVVVVAVVVGAMLMGLFVGFSYVFLAITAEKTQRTTESLLSVVSPQQWIDGKILGLTGVVLFDLLGILTAWFLWQTVSWLLLDGSIALPPGLGGWAFALCLVFAAGGFAFWFTVFALIAATIDDPNSSSRSAFMFLPFLPLGLVFAGLDSPDAGWMRALALIPGVSPSAMPVRILRGDPAAWEVVLSLALLAAGVLALRWAAGRIFGLSMMMTGKEPGWREVWRWLREAS